MMGFASNRRRAMGALAMLAALTAPAAAQDKVKVGVFPVSSTLPYFVAVERGFFKEQNIETEMVRLIGGPPNVAAMITNQIDASAVLVTIEGMNANIKKPGVAMYVSVNSQNRTYQMEQFVARKGYHATSLKDLKGAKIMSAPGPANVTMAKAALAAVGLKEGDYSIDQLDMGQHVNAMTAGTFDAGYTLEPNASTMRKLGVATTIEAGVIAHYVLGDPDANAFVGGCALVDFGDENDEMIEPGDHGNSPRVFLAARTFSTPIAIAAVRCEILSVRARVSICSKARSRI